MKKMFLILAGVLVGATVPVAYASSRLSNGRVGSVDKSQVHRIVDSQAGVVCYVIPESHCMGDCAYSPAIACAKQ